MRKAYDTILSDYVDADTAAQNSGFEPYRYECACCWEEVHLCAADSQNQATHFRHRSGNNNIECENYLGNRNLIIRNALSRRNVREKVEFYFSNTTKMFSISVKFSAEEIAAYEQSGTFFQVRNASATKPAISIPIRDSRFLPDTPELIPIIEFSWIYYVSSSNDAKQQKYELFRKDGYGYLYPSFFKMQSDDDDNTFQAKLVRSETLYTNTPYLIVFTHQHQTFNFQNDVKTGKVIKFRTLDRDFSAVVITFTNKTTKTEQQLEAWKYKLEANETLTLLWPPSSQFDESICISEKYAYIFSTFEMQAHGNVNVHSEDIVKLGNGISKISIKSRTKIYKKNAELVFDKYDCTMDEFDTITVVQETFKSYVAPDNEAYLFNYCGVSQLKKGMYISLTSEREVRHYSFGYLDHIVKAPVNTKALSGDHLLQDILKHYKYDESFNWKDYELLELSPVSLQYLETCKSTGRINSAAKHFIEEGRI